MGDEIVGREIRLTLSRCLAHRSEGNQQGEERAIECDRSQSPRPDGSLLLLRCEKKVRLLFQLRDIGQCDLLLDGCCELGLKSVAPEKERCEGR